MEHHNKIYNQNSIRKPMNRKIKSLVAPILSLPFFLNIPSTINSQPIVPQFVNLEQKIISNSSKEVYLGNSLIPLINQKINSEKLPDFHIQVDKKNLRLKLFQKRRDEEVFLLETSVALGRKGWGTPAGNFYLRRIINLPIWYPPVWANTKKIQKPGKNNPYGLWMSELSKRDEKGTHDFSISGDSLIRIHSTDEPLSIGKYLSHGCIRLPPEFAEELFPAFLHYLPHKEPKKNARGIIYPLEKTIPVIIR